MAGNQSQGCTGVVSGAGTQVLIGAVRPDCVEPTSFVATVATAAAAGATSLTLDADLPVGVYIPNEYFLSALNPDGSEVVFQVGQLVDIQTGDTVGATTPLTVLALPADIQVGAIICYPLVLRGRESADITANITRATTVQLEDFGGTAGLNVAQDITVGLSGNYIPGDAGFTNFRIAAIGDRSTAAQDVYIWIVDPVSVGITDHGEVYHGNLNTTSFSKSISSTDLTKSALEGAFNGKPTIVEADTNTPGYFQDATGNLP